MGAACSSEYDYEVEIQAWPDGLKALELIDQVGRTPTCKHVHTHVHVKANACVVMTNLQQCMHTYSSVIFCRSVLLLSVHVTSASPKASTSTKSMPAWVNLRQALLTNHHPNPCD